MQNDGVDTDRRRFLTAAATVVGGVGAVAGAVPFVATMTPSEKTKAIGAPVEVDISGMQPGDRIVKKWQGKPVWVLRRDDKALASISDLNSEVSDPESSLPEQPDYAQNEYRARESEYLVVVGLCTHLGCSPSYVKEEEADAFALGDDWQGGFFCPCHGSKFDLAGRVYKGMPAPKNLLVPPYKFVGDNLIIIGDDSEATS